MNKVINHDFIQVGKVTSMVRMVEFVTMVHLES